MLSYIMVRQACSEQAGLRADGVRNTVCGGPGRRVADASDFFQDEFQKEIIIMLMMVVGNEPVRFMKGQCCA